MMRARLGCILVAVLLCAGCSDDDGGGDGRDGGGSANDAAAGSDGSNADTSAALATLGGSVVEFNDGDSEPAVAGATVSVVGDSANSTTTDAAGSFSLQVPVGPGFVLLAKDGLLSSIYGGIVPAAGATDAEFGLVVPAVLDGLVAGLSSLDARDSSKGHLVVEFDLDARGEAALGTEKATISASDAASIVFDANDDPQLGDTLIAGADSSIIFYNVPAGQVTLTLSAPGCTANMAATQSYPVQANTVTFIDVSCE